MSLTQARLRRQRPIHGDFWTQVSTKWADAEGVKGTGYAPLVKYGADQWITGGMSELFG